jgi:hypothetical protein
MNQGGSDKRLLLPGIVVVLAILGAWYGDLLLGEEQQRLDIAQRVSESEISRIRAARVALAADQQFLMDNRAAAEAMQSAKFLEPQDRLQLTQAVQALGAAHGLNRVRVSVEPEQVLADMPYASETVALVSTPVSINLDAASERDVLAVLERLPGLFSGVAIVETAHLRGVSAHAQQVGADQRPTVMTAQIVVRWQTLKSMADGSDLTSAGQ